MRPEIRARYGLSIEDVRNKIIADAKSLPELIQLAEQADPDFAKQLKSKALISSKSVWVTMASSAVSWVVTRYALNWDADTCMVATWVVITVCAAAVRWVTAGPIGGFFRAGKS